MVSEEEVQCDDVDKDDKGDTADTADRVTGIYRTMGCTGPYWAVLGCSGLQWTAGLYWAALG